LRLVLGAAVAAALAAAAAAPAQRDLPTRDCSTRIEAGSGPIAFPRRGLVVGPVALSAVDASRIRLYRDDSGRYFAKSALLIKAGHTASLAVPPPFRGLMLLAHARPEPAPLVRFEACRPETRAFSYDGTVGRVTAFNGGFVLTRPGCYPLDIRVDGGGATRVRLPFGRPCR